MFDKESSPSRTKDSPNGPDSPLCVDRRRFLTASGIVGATLTSGLGAATAPSPSTDGGYGTQAYGAAGYGGESTN